MTLIKDLIEIPERVQKGDFVLRLSEGVTRPEETLRHYVVTPALQKCFDNALAFIQSAVSERTSKASYLHGSFGSGKSHFMAVLHLLLQAHPTARAIAELAGTVQKHNEWIGGKKFLLVPYHMIGARDMESGILGGYVEFVRRRHPEAPVPGVYKAEGLFRDAGMIREAMGDAKFFSKLNEGAQSGGWGELELPWDPERFESAVASPPDSEERTRLISSLVTRFFGSYDQQAGGKGEAFISLDQGLSVISKHAAALGYDALILFLDELVLWLASRASNVGFVHQEGQKLAKLVESQSPDRPTPIISFIARQRDLSELIGKNVPGAQVLNFKDALGHWEGRFHTITLEDRNLPAIAEKRVLRCKSESARTQLDAAFELTARAREAVMNVLLTSDGDRQMFRKVYPFSPALVQTLIAVSSVLQRERTALKVMMQLLVDSRDTLKVGDLVPVGDLFDVIAHGDEAFSPEMAMHFDNAKRLYHQKLLPMLEKQQGVREEEIGKLPFEDPKRTSFRNDDRLLKTLLLSALVPEVESLRALTAERLAALNHGTIKTPIPGTEGQEVLRKCRAWAATVGEIRLGTGANPTISVQLSGVDTEVILAQARREDNPGNRMRLIRQMLFEQLAIQGEGELEQYHEQLWRGARRTASVLVRNLRDLTDPTFENSDETWKLLIGLPFDEPGRSPRDHVSHLQGFLERNRNGARTLCWVPAFLGPDAQEDLGTLVVLEHVLTGERFGAFANHLSPQDRGAAKSLLDNQRSVLRQRVMQHLESAYGLAMAPSGALDANHDFELADRFVSLTPGFTPQPPPAATLGAALSGFLEQALEHQYPGAPAFETEVKSGSLKKIYEVCLEATRSQDGRVPVEKTLRLVVRQIVNPLLIGEIGVDATHFLLGQHWKQHFTRNHAQVGGKMTVKQLREWINIPKRMGLSKEAESLVILVFASQTNRSVYRHGGPYEPSLASLPDDCELREQKLPEPGIWTTAHRRAGHIFGIATASLMNALNVNRISVEAKESALRGRDFSRAYAQHLGERVSSLGLQVESAPRLRTAQATSALIETLHAGKVEDVIGILAAAPVNTTEEAMGECFRRAGELDGILTGASWPMLEAISSFTDERRSAAIQILEDIKKAMTSDEHVIALGPTLKDALTRALRLLTPPKPSPLPPPLQPQPPPPQPGEKSGRSDNLDAAACDKLMKDLTRQLKPGEMLRVSLTWVIRQEGKKA